MNETKKTHRIEYIDNMRGILMALGIVLHCAAVFAVDKYWLVSYRHASVWMDGLNDAIHVFRMPLFFMIAGYFAVMLLQRYAVSSFLLQRAKRILIPLVSTFVLLNSLQSVIIYHYEVHLNAGKAQAEASLHFALSHLWFLVNLFVYCCVLVLLFPILKRLKSALCEKGEHLAFWLMLVLLPFLYIGFLAAGKVGLPVYKNVPVLGMLHMLVYYFGFFLFGVCILLCQSWIKKIEKHWLLWAVLSFLTTAVLLSLPHILFSTTQRGGLLFTVFLQYLMSLHALLICFLLWSLFARLAKQSFAWMRELSDASYTIYLFHHFWVVLLAILLNVTGLDMPAEVLFVAMVLLVYFITMNIHKYIIKRSAILTLLFNGK